MWAIANHQEIRREKESGECCSRYIIYIFARVEIAGGKKEKEQKSKKSTLWNLLYLVVDFMAWK